MQTDERLGYIDDRDDDSLAPFVILEDFCQCHEPRAFVAFGLNSPMAGKACSLRVPIGDANR